MPELTVRDVMTEGVISCSPDAGLEDVAALMRERGISALVVVDGGVAAGVISQTDLVNAAFVQPYLRYWRGMTARHLMSAPVVAVRPDALLADAIELLRSRRIHRVVVTEPTPAGERPVGILSTTDIARLHGAPTVGAGPARSDIDR
jgi:CBS domain-containing protein